MKTTLLFRENSPSEAAAQQLAERLEGYQVPTDIINVDSLRGSQLAELYDVVDYPALLITDEFGTEVAKWQARLPEPSEVSYLAHS